jgi:hypothetical protein
MPVSKPNRNNTQGNAARVPADRRLSRRGFVIAVVAYGLWLAFLIVLAVIQPAPQDAPDRNGQPPAVQPAEPPVETPNS